MARPTLEEIFGQPATNLTPPPAAPTGKKRPSLEEIFSTPGTGDTKPSLDSIFNTQNAAEGNMPDPNSPEELQALSDEDLMARLQSEKKGKGLFGLDAFRGSDKAEAEKLGRDRKKALKLGGDALNFVTESTVKPILKLPVAVGATAANAAGNVWEAYTNPNKSFQDTLDQSTREINLPWLGNVNLLTKNKEGGDFDTAAGVRKTVGLGADAILGKLNLTNPVSGFFKNFVRGGAQSAAKAVQRDEVDPVGLALETLLGGTLSGGFAKLPDLVKGFRGKRADIMGVSDITKKTLENVDNIPAFQQGLEVAKKTAGDVTKAKPIEKVASSFADDYLGGFKDARSAAGAKIDPFIVKAPPVKVTGALGEFKKSLTDDLGVIVGKGGKLDFSESSIASDTNGQRVIENLYKKFFTAKGTSIWKELPATDVRKRILDISKNVLDLTPDNPGKVGDVASVPISKFVDSLDSSLKSVLPDDAHAAYDAFREIAKTDSFLQPYIGPKKNTATVLNQLFSSSRKNELVPNLQKFGDVVGKDYINEANIAKSIQDTTKTTKATNIKDALLQMLMKPKESAVQGLINQATGKRATESILPKSLQGLAKFFPKGWTSKGNAVPIGLQQALAQMFQPSPEDQYQF